MMTMLEQAYIWIAHDGYQTQDELLTFLQSPNAWLREAAFKILKERIWLEYDYDEIRALQFKLETMSGDYVARLKTAARDEITYRIIGC